MASTGTDKRQLSVGVLVDLHRGIAAGGHVKCWEHLAGAAEGEDLDLTIYFLGSRAGTESVSENLRYVTVRPLLGTERIPFLGQIAAHTDLAPLHPEVLDALRWHHVLHSTDAYFSLARTALFLAKRDRRALVSS
ncbi:MAG: glycosyltransferase family 1 protein, partial [Acidobacteria bacterium]|nr:glycosyltransferase family 1 protein [Acidobacteriota bacterium]